MIEFIWDGLSGPNFDLYRGLLNLSAALLLRLLCWSCFLKLFQNGLNP